MTEILIAVIVAITLFAVVMLFMIGQFLNLYIQAMLSRAPVSIFDILGMCLRKVDVRTVIYSRIRCVRSGMDIPARHLETHFLAGGRVANVVSAMIAARTAGIDLDWDRATAIDLAGRDVLNAVQTAVNPFTIECPSQADGPDAIYAAARDGVLLRARARVVLRTNIARLVGGATVETIVTRVGEAIVSTVETYERHEQVLAEAHRISRVLQDQGLGAGTAFDIVSIELKIGRDESLRENGSIPAEAAPPW